MGGLMHEGLIHGPVTQVLRKDELIHGEAYTQWGGGGGGGLTGREIRHIIRSLLSQLLTVLCLFKKCTVKVSSKHLFSKLPGWYSVRDSLLEKGVIISVKCILWPI